MPQEPDFSDTLTQNTEEYQWTEVRRIDGSCVFRNGYHITTLDQFYRFYKGISAVLVLSDFRLQVDMKIKAGEEGGVLFRWNKGRPDDTFYYFYLGTDGIFGLLKGEKTNLPEQHRVLVSGHNKHVNKGLDQQNKLMVRAVGQVIELYVNEQFLARINDNANPHLIGHIGFASGPEPSEAIFSNLKIWLSS